MNHEPELERLRRRERELEAELEHLRARTLGAAAGSGQVSLRGMRTTAIGPAELFAAVEKTWMPMILSDPNQPDSPIVFANRAFQELSGYGADELIGRNCRFLQGPDTDPAQVRKIREAVAAQRDMAIEILNYRRDGTTFFNELYISPIFDEDGRLLYYFGSQFDVTGFRQDRRLMEEGLRRQKAIFDSAADLAIFATDRDGLITEWNSGAERIFGWSAAEMRGASASLVFTPEDQQAARLPREMRKALAEDRAISERWHVRQDGSRFWGSGDMTPLLDESGFHNGFLNILRDRTEQHLAAEKLAESERRYRTLFEALDAGFCVIEVKFDAVGRPFDYVYLEVNPAFAAQTGFSNVISRRVSELLPLHEQFWYDIYGGVARTGKPARFEHAEEALGRWYDVNAFRVEEGENRVAVLFRDISKRRHVERDLQALTASLETEVQTRTGELMAAEEALRQSQKMEAVGQLTGGLAHDFNNLLTSITGSLELLNIRVTQGRINDLDRYITAAQGAAARAAALTHRLLAFSRRQTLAPRPTDVNRLVADMDELIRRTVGPAITLRMHLDPELWTTLVDPNQLENALLNLCINARDAMPEGGRLTVETSNTVLDTRAARERDFAPGQYISLFVTDTGTGMDPEVIARAFDPFFTTKPLGMGTGLGLSMIYGFAKQSDGQVRIHSALGQGTTVRLYLPRHQGEAAVAEPGPGLVNAPRAATDETVLVVDDEPTVRMLVTEVLEDLGYTAIEAADGAAGLKVLQSNARIDLLVTDVGLPGGMNGRQMADAARNDRPALKVLFITGYAENAVLSHGHLDHGMHVLTKPFAMDTLAGRIKDLIRGELG